MKKLAMLLAVVFAFAFTSMAQTSTSSSQSDQTSATTSKSKSKKGSSSDMSEGAAASDTSAGKTGKAKKNSTLTGCLNSDATMLTNGHYKNGVKVGPEDKVKEHANHQVSLTGQWAGSGADKSFEVASVKHLSETCTAAKGGGTTGSTKKGAKSKDTSAAPKS
jgi:hypothetical protein